MRLHKLQLNLSKNDKINVFIDGQFVARLYLNQFALLFTAQMQFDIPSNVELLRDKLFIQFERKGIGIDNKMYPYFIQWQNILQGEIQ